MYTELTPLVTSKAHPQIPKANSGKSDSQNPKTSYFGKSDSQSPRTSYSGKSPPLFPNEDDATYRCELAAMYVIDGLCGRKTNAERSYRNKARIRRHAHFSNRWWNRFVMLCAFIDIFVLPMIEDYVVYSNPDHIIYLWITEFFCLIAFIIDICLYFSLFRCHPEQPDKRWPIARVVVLLVMVCDFLYRIISGHQQRKIGRFLCPFVLLFRKRSLRIFITGSVRVIKRSIGIILLIGFEILFFAYLDYILFSRGFKQEAALDVVGGTPTNRMYFRTFGQCVYNMLIIQTSVTQILAGMDYAHRKFVLEAFSHIFFTAFLVIGNLFLLRVIVFVAYLVFREHSQYFQDQRQCRMDIALKYAFDLISTPDETNMLPQSSVDNKKNYFNNKQLTSEMWYCLMKRIRPNITREHCDNFYISTQIDETVPIQFSEFNTLIQLGVSAPIDAVANQSQSTIGQIRKKLKMFFEAGVEFKCNGTRIFWRYWDILIMVLILIMVIMSFLLTTVTATGDWSPFLSWWIAASILFYVFLLECMFKLWALGWSTYIKDPFNCLDLMVNILSLFLWIYTMLNLSSNSEDKFTRFVPSPWVYNWECITNIRALRLIRILCFMTQYQRMSFAVRASSLVLLKILGFWLITLYLFAVVGQWLYIDSLTPDNPLLAHSTWIPLSNVMNFDTFLNSMTTMFEVSYLVNWPVVMNACVTVTSTASYFFFFGCRLLMEMIIIPILLGAVMQTMDEEFIYFDNLRNSYVSSRDEDQTPISTEYALIPRGTMSLNTHTSEMALKSYARRMTEKKRKEKKNI